MSKCWQLGALMKKNAILMKRSLVATLCEIFFPMILMGLLVLLRKAIKIDDIVMPSDEFVYLKTESSAFLNPDLMPINSTSWNGLSIRRPLEICKMRKVIAAIGDPQDLANITEKISKLFPYSQSKLSFKQFSTIEATNKYVADPGYGTNDNPEICFGFYFSQLNSTHFEYSLHYFDAIVKGSNQDTPNTLKKSLDPFQKGPDLTSYQMWLNSGYLEIMKIINDNILQRLTQNPNAQITYGVMAQKYSFYKSDPFGEAFGFILPFFLIIAYVSPLSVLVFRMVQEKETKAKEGLKVMGLNESVYFLSFFIQWLILNTLYSLINSLILTQVFTNIEFFFIFSFFWLFGMCIFSLAYFFQSVMNRTRIAMVISILVYFVMYLVSVAFITDDIGNTGKMLISLLPPTCLQLGLSVLAKYNSSFIIFGFKEFTNKYNNYSVSDMYIMLTVDICLYLFLGFYLQNVLSQQFGIRKPYNFLCMKSFWCKKKKNINKISMTEDNYNQNNNIKDPLINFNKNSDSDQINQNNFQSEVAYEDYIKSGNCLQIKNLRKEFDDGKVAVNGLNLNFYNNEIFALLGHNGAGKSTTISILCGLYEASGGSAFYKGENILDDNNMEEFRKKLGICPQHDVLFDNLTVREHLNMFSIFKGVPSSDIEKEIDQILRDVNMTEKSDDLAKNLSGGMKRKLSIAIALIGGSEVVFLDEPSSGMDITSRRNLWEILKKCSGNRIIILTTHYMEEAAVLGNRIGIVSNGKLRCSGNGLFLIDRFGKYLSLNIYKVQNANDSEIIEFINERIPNVEYEVLSEEILFRIPKNYDKKFSFKSFFSELDDNLSKLGIKSYGASYPTLEDVFLNVSADNEGKKMDKSSIVKKGDMSMIEYQDLYKNYSTTTTKYFSDFKVSVKKRFYQIIRDKKTFFLEMLSPIILIIIGLTITSVHFFKDSPMVKVSLTLLPTGQQIFINKNFPDGSQNPIIFEDSENFNVTFNYLESNYLNSLSNSSSIETSLVNYNDVLFKKNSSNSFGSYYILNFDKTNHQYEYISFINTQSRNAPIIYTQYMANQVFGMASKNNNINIKFSHEPFPLTNQVKRQGETQNTTNLVFFVSIAFSLIPANFITLIIKERETNTKHLQIISGISLFSYWLSNFVFELVKYYVIGGVCLLIIYSWGNFPSYLWLLYALYGLSMTSFTYLFSLVFKKESSAQNSVILINFLFGALGSTVVLVLRIYPDLMNTAKILAYCFRIIPCFCFAYGYNQLLSYQLLFYADDPLHFSTMVLTPNEYLIKPDYIGSDLIFMVCEFLVFLLILILYESFGKLKKSNKGSSKSDKYIEENINVNDTVVRREIEKANEPDTSLEKYSIKVKNLEKKYSSGFLCPKKFTAVNKLSFCLEFGECFALLGVNGAGKTTTFKTLTSEHSADGGEIYINGMNISTNFDKVRNLIGYCPQYDAIFDYMTVYENLDFYARLKGIPDENVANVVSALMRELNLAQYRNKISGNLSGGNKRKLSVGIAMIGNPPIILLDEPSTGMDPEARRFMWAVIHKISTRNKLSSVILTTHSMEEAETLCKRIGIMVAGQFKCLGTAQSIKDKYGFGYEIDLRIQIMPDNVLKEILSSYVTLNPDESLLNMSDVQRVLILIRKSNFIHDVLLRREITEEINLKGKVTIKRLLEWVFYTENSLKCISKILNYFEDVSILESWDNNFKIKIIKNNKGYTIGFLFGLIEDCKEECYLSEYSISQTSLEQIFNKFANSKNETIDTDEENKEVKLTNDYVQPILNSD